jgi:Zn-dependent peptidase ImmA (M78 family)
MASIKNAEKVAASLLEQHQAIHPPIDVQEHLVHFRADASTKQTDPKEIEANFFAAALLLPKEILVADVRERQLDAMDEVALKMLAERYGVSQQALTLRLLNLGLLGGMQAGSALP